eukprot:m51a1_g13423 hypothetical protein (478) ;mRNA; r:420-2039
MSASSTSAAHTGDAPAAAPAPTKIVFDHVPTRCASLAVTGASAVSQVGEILQALTAETAILRSTSDEAFLEAAWSGSKDAEIISAQQSELTVQRSIADLALRCLHDVSEEQVRQSERTGSLLSDCFAAIGEAKAEVCQKEHDVATQAVTFGDMLQRLIENNNARHDKKDAEFKQEREALATMLTKKDADAEKARQDFIAVLARKDADAQKERADYATMLAKKDADAEKARQDFTADAQKARQDFAADAQKAREDFAAVLARKDADAQKERADYATMLAKKDADAEKAHQEFAADAQKERADFAAMLAKKDADAEKARQDFTAVLATKDAEAQKEREAFKAKMEEVTNRLQYVSDQMSIVRLGDLSLTAEVILQKTFDSDERASKLCAKHDGEVVHGVKVTSKLGKALHTAGIARLVAVHKARSNPTEFMSEAALALVSSDTLSSGVPAAELRPALDLVQAVSPEFLSEALSRKYPAS